MTDPFDDNEQRKKSLIDSLGPVDAPADAPVDGPPLAAPGGFAPTGGLLDPKTEGPPPLGAPAGGSAPSLPPLGAPKTNGYDAPKYTPGANTFAAPGGYDAAKFADTQHQSPKYAVARIMQEAAGGKGNLADEGERNTAIANIQKAYPGAQMVSKDKIRMPDGGIVDIFKGAGSGEYGIAWQPETGPGGAPLEQAAGGQGGGGQFAPTISGPLDAQLGGNPLEAIQAALAKYSQGNRPNMDALLAQLGQ